MPRVYRTMKREDDGFPTVEQSGSGLGVRAGIDVDLDEQGNVLANGKGMSVAPAWRELNFTLIPKRLRDKFPGARGSNNRFCFRAGTGPFARSSFAHGLELVPDSRKHGCIAPLAMVPLVQYQDDLKATRPDWQLDES